MELKINKARFIIDLTIFSLCSIIAIVLRFTNLPIPTKRGFFCDDSSIRYPHFGQTVTEAMMLISSFSTGLVLIIATESVLYYTSNVRKPTTIAGLKCSSVLYFTYKYLYSFILSIVIVFLIQWTFSRFIGRLRPSFIDLCKPDIDLGNCTSSEYILNYSCTEPLESEFLARTSFPSGHTSISVCSATYLAIYIWTRWNKALILEKLFAGILLYVGAILIAVSRYINNLHHSTDIIGGIVLGILVGFSMAKFAHGWCNTENNEVAEEEEKRSLLQPEPEPVNTGNGR